MFMPCLGEEVGDLQCLYKNGVIAAVDTHRMCFVAVLLRWVPSLPGRRVVFVEGRYYYTEGVLFFTFAACRLGHPPP